MPIRIAINGFGRIGRAFFKQAFGNQDLEIIAINDLGNIDNLAYLLKRDTVYGNYDKKVEVEKGEKNYLIVENKKFLVLSEKDPLNLPWKELDIDIVIESTGVFTSKDKAQAHIEAGAKRVVISAPGKEGVEQIIVKVDEDKLLKKNVNITSNASCTTNAVVPPMAVLSKELGIEKAFLTTIHAYTATQALVDGPSRSKDFLRGRAAAQNIVPSSTGAAKATAKSVRSLENLFDGIAVRVPVVCGSLIDLTFISKKDTSVEQVNSILINASKTDEWKDIMEVSQEPLVSSDIIGNPHPSIVDLSLTRVVGGNLVKVFAWYDNEWGYVASLIRHTVLIGKSIKN